LDQWPDSYWNHINRNIGPIRFDEQEQLRTTIVAVLGCGGLGGPLAEHLVRAGCEHLILCDNDRFDESNLNRQVCTRRDMGKYKIDVLTRYLKAINPEVSIHKVYEVTPENVDHLVQGCEIATLTLDDPIASILIARACKRAGIPLLETWGIPYLWAWYFTNDSISFEECYDLNTHHLNDDELNVSTSVALEYKTKLLTKLCQFPRIHETYDRQFLSIKEMLEGTLSLRSFSPFIRMAATYLSIELIFAGILDLKPKILAPHVIGYDYLHNSPINFILSPSTR
jgi:hypothetical protein